MPRNLGLLKSRILRPNPWTGCCLEIEARVSEVGDNTIVLLGITSETDTSTKYEIDNDENIPASSLLLNSDQGFGRNMRLFNSPKFRGILLLLT